MFVAQELKKKSIAEYLLYMWQVEDIIRAYGCSLPVIKKQYIDRFNFTDEQKDEEIDWFGNLIRMMNEEGKRESGHLNINKVLLKDVIDLHGMLLQSTKFPIYNAEYYKVLPFIVELRNRGDKTVNEIETCLDALYGVMMLRLQKKPITPETERAIKEITTFVGLLSDYYIKDRTEGLDFDENSIALRPESQATWRILGTGMSWDAAANLQIP